MLVVQVCDHYVEILFTIWPSYCWWYFKTSLHRAITMVCTCQVLVQREIFIFCQYLWNTWDHVFVVFFFVFHGNHKVHSACKAFTHFPFAFLSWLNKLLVVVGFCPIGRSSVGNHWSTFVLIYYYFRINLYTTRFSLRFDFGGRKDIR